jgi:ADP-ribose pyrophosphatase YjhB (NUDIX family)
MKQIALINPENVTDEEVVTYAVREAARAVVVDSAGKVALLHVSQVHYYKLPGGGLEGDEDRLAALSRECQEEIGCDVDVIGEIGMIVEYRKIFTLKQISYCYFARVKGEKGTPHFMPDEMEEGFEVVWLEYTDALQAISHSRADDAEGRMYIVPRDIAFLKGARLLVR